jgi:murein DD-endopeptidase MepM/ murein hydrolase activator NlpD
VSARATALRLGALALALSLCSTPLFAQTAYKYKDANGQWVFTDSAPAAATAKQDSFSLNHQTETLQNTIERTDSGHTTQFTAINTCLCVSTFLLRIIRSDDPDIPNGTEYGKILQPQSKELLVTVKNAGPDPVQGPDKGTPSVDFFWRIALGSPDAQHKPPGPYRVPFALGATYVISQAYPDKFTHTTPESQYAVDIALPDETAVYAARDGVVINVRHDAFRGGASQAMMDEANVVDILHDDGTIAMYAHLHWDSIRVHIGEHVTRGEYLANSGSTGFSTGPHLHFVVIRNDHFNGVSVPIEFAGPSGVPITPMTRNSLTAY